VSDEIGGLSDDSASPAGNRRKPKKLVNREIVSLDTVPQDTIPQDRVPQDTVSLDTAPPSELADLFADPPLVGNEKREDFDRFFSAINAAVKPVDAIAWLYTWDVVYLSWEIRRERTVKADIIKSAQMDFVSELLGSNNLVQSTRTGLSKKLPRLQPKGEARQWFKNPKSQPEAAKILADNGYECSDILAEAYILGADNIDAIDRRIASYEIRRMAVMRAVEDYNEKFAQKLDAASEDMIEAEFKDLPPENA
jgi:hypothetical protein